MGTISEKLTYLNDTKSLLKDSINSLGGEITSQTTFRQYATELDSIYSNLPKVSGTGSILSLTPTLKGRLGSVLKGNTFQQTYTGKNLLPINQIQSQTINGITITNLSDGTIKINGTTTSTTRIDVSYTKSLIANTTYKFINSYKRNNSTANVNIQDANSSVIGSITLNNINSTFTPNSDVEITKMRLYIDSSQTFDNYILKVMLIKSTETETYEPYTGGTASPNPDYPQEIQSATGLQTIVVSDGTNTQTKELNLGNIKLNKIGDYQDYITGTPDNWSIKRQIGSVVLDGSETIGTDGSTTTYKRYTISKSVFPNISGESALSNYFTYLSNYSSDTQHFYIGTNNLYFFLLTPTSTANDFKTWLSTHNTEIDYVLATETTEAITNQEIVNQLNEIYYLQSYNGTTNITITSEDLELIMTASALKGEA